MKRTLSFMVMALALLLTQCRKPEVKFPTPSSAEGVTVSMTVTAGPGSKTDITAAGAITWSTGDKLYVGYDGNYVGCLEIQDGMGNATGTFSGTLTLGENVTDEQTFHFFYLGSVDYTDRLTKGTSTTVDVDFSSQNIYNNGVKLENASAQHVGYGTANGTVTDGVVTGINVTLVSKVALARFSFKKNSADYTEALTLSGDNIYNSMKVNFGGTFTGEKTDGGNISLGAGHAERYVMLVPPADVAAETLNFDGGAGTTILENGIEANKFYGKSDAIAVSLHETVNFGTPNLNWSVCNLGATNGETIESWYGDYYAWGATETWYSAGGQSESPTWKDGYSDGYTWKHCPHTNGTYSGSNTNVFTKYISTGKPEYWAEGGDPDNKLVLESSDDAAAVAWGSDWRMPTSDEWQKLYNNNTFEWLDAAESDETYGTGFKAVAAGYLVVKGGKNSIASDASVYMFLPAAGARSRENYLSPGEIGYYWSSSLEADVPYRAFRIQIRKESVEPLGGFDRRYGLAVRPVR